VNQLALFCVVSLGSAAARPPLLAVRRPKEVITGPGLHLAAVATVPKLDPDRIHWDKIIDGGLSAFGAAAGIALLCLLEKPMGVKLYAPPLAAAAIIIFSGPKPPPVRNLFLGTSGPVAISALVRSFGGPGLTPRIVALGLSMAWFKTSSSFFPPAAAASVVLVDSLPPFGKAWLTAFVPALVGTTMLYGTAFGVGKIREQVKYSLKVKALKTLPHDSLKSCFKRYDSSGDGYIDAEELRLALRSNGVDMTLEDVTSIVRGTDSDGDGYIDFDDFCTIFGGTPKRLEAGGAGQKKVKAA